MHQTLQWCSAMQQMMQQCNAKQLASASCQCKVPMQHAMQQYKAMQQAMHWCNVMHQTMQQFNPQQQQCTDTMQSNMLVQDASAKCPCSMLHLNSWCTMATAVLSQCRCVWRASNTKSMQNQTSHLLVKLGCTNQTPCAVSHAPIKTWCGAQITQSVVSQGVDPILQELM